MGILNNIINWFTSRIKPVPIPPPLPTPPPPVPGGDPLEEIKNKLLLFHNNERSKHGIIPLTRNSSLDNAAQKHNDWMVARSNLNHNEPGHDLGKRISDEGYSWSWIGENIAEGQSSVEEVMNSWMNSPGHRSNILSKNYKDVGFGVTKNNNTWWWTTDFGSK